MDQGLPPTMGRAFLRVLFEYLGPHEDLLCEMVLIGATSPPLQFVQVIRNEHKERV